MAQLPHVARPAVAEQAFQRPTGQTEAHAAAGGFFVEDTVDQRQPVAALAQRRQLEAGAAEAEVQVFAKFTGHHQRRQVAVAGTDHLDVHAFPARGAQRRHFALGQHAQQAGLQAERHVSDLVEEQGAAVGLLQQPAHTLAGSPGEGAGDIAEQLALDQAFRNRRTVQRHERLVAAGAGFVQLAGEDLLAGAGFAVDQHRQVAILDPHRQAQAFLDARVDLLRTRARHGNVQRALRYAQAHMQVMSGQPAWRLIRRLAQGVQVEDFADMLRNHPVQPLQITPCRRIERQQAAVVVPGEQVVRLAVDVARRSVGAQQPVAFGAVHEERVLDLAGALHHHLADQVLAAAVVRGFHRGDVEHAEQLALRVEYRRRRAGQADEGGAEVIALVHGDRLAAGQHRRHPAGALLAFRPAGAEVQTGAPAVAANRRFDAVVDGLPLGIGEQHAVVGVAHPAMQARDFLAGDAQEHLGAPAALLQHRLAEDARALQRTGVEMVGLHRAPPGIEDQRRYRCIGQAIGIAQHAADAIHVGFRVGRKQGWPPVLVLIVVPPIKRRSPAGDKHEAGSGPA
ncbi:hypothetical protein D3C76_674650 [compost metagenome]